MDHLWSPWRFEYVTRGEDMDDGGCVFCKAPDLPEIDSLLVFSGTSSYVILNLYPYNSGHLMVVPQRHVGSLAALTREELAEIMLLTQRCEMALTEVYQPQGINVGINLGRPAGAGIVDHVHVHLVPRWTGDTNFMSVVGNVRVLPEEVGQSAERLRPVFARLQAEA
jgi:ATP adenylyltransferase